MVTTILVILLLTLFLIVFFRQPAFGRTPSGKRLKALEDSRNYKNGSFSNLHVTPMLSEDSTYFNVLREFFFKRNPRRVPSKPIPTKKTDLLNLQISEDILVWFWPFILFYAA